MTSAQQWVVNPKKRFIMCQTHEIAEVQLDAWKQGMRDAAEIALNNAHNTTPNGLRLLILEVMNKREKL